MAKGTRGRRGIASRQCRPTPYPLPSHKEKEEMQQMNCSKAFGSAGNVGSNRGTRRQERDPNSALDRGSMRLHRDNAVDDLDYSDQDSDDNDDDNGNENDGNGGTSLADRLHRQGRVLLGRSGRRRRQREEVNHGRR